MAGIRGHSPASGCLPPLLVAVGAVVLGERQRPGSGKFVAGGLVGLALLLFLVVALVRLVHARRRGR